MKNLSRCEDVTMIYKTFNYDMFKYIGGNRLINKLNYKKLSESMKEKQLVIPILVNDKMEIIDGQHRYQSCRELGMPVYFYIAEGYNLSDVKRANLVNRVWNKNDYLHSYMEEMNQNYIDFYNIKETYKVNINDVLKVFALTQDIGLKDLSQDFDSGRFISEGKEIVTNFFDSLNDFKLFDKYRSTQFVGAFIKLYFNPGYDHKKMKEKLTKRGYLVKRKGSIAEYLQMLTKDIYSFGAVKDPIYYDSQTKKFYS